MNDNHITPAEFQILTQLTSWATSGTTDDHKNENINTEQEKEESEIVDHYSGLTSLRREEIGYMAKRILDFGRILYLKDRGKYNVQLIQYVESNVTLENLALVLNKVNP